jgi:hypothetical protein
MDAIRFPPPARHCKQVLVLGFLQIAVDFNYSDFGEQRLFDIVHEVHAETVGSDCLKCELKEIAKTQRNLPLP